MYIQQRMRIACCIQAQDTGRILFIQETTPANLKQWQWTWPVTDGLFDWISNGTSPGDSLRRELARYYDITDIVIEMYASKNMIQVTHLRVPSEGPVYTTADYGWHSLFEFPEKVHPFVESVTSDLLFLEALVRSGQ